MVGAIALGKPIPGFSPGRVVAGESPAYAPWAPIALGAIMLALTAPKKQPRRILGASNCAACRQRKRWTIG